MRIPDSPPTIQPILTAMDQETLARAIAAAGEVTGYPSWDRFRRRPTPDGVTSEQVWALIKLQRKFSYLPLVDSGGKLFKYSAPTEVNRLLHEISVRTAGMLPATGPLTGAQRDRYLLSSLREEAVSSSLLEGAATTRRDAKEMLREQRAPRTAGERMVADNFAAMEWIRERMDEPITPSLVLELHSILTEGTLEDSRDEGRLQQPGEERVFVAGLDDAIMHTPPPAEESPQRLEALCRFASASSDGPSDWVHPLVRAIVTHFMVGYDHYFVDGNGRTARALFYWVALREGHWLLEFLSISRLLNDAPAQYGRAYLETEADDGDVTYFLLHQLRVLSRSLDSLDEYLARKQREAAAAEVAARSLRLNPRQQAVIGRAMIDPSTVFTARSHASSHGVALQTARSDLEQLEAFGLLTSAKIGRRVQWWANGDVAAKLASH